jgi:hypothetical protein
LIAFISVKEFGLSQERVNNSKKINVLKYFIFLTNLKQDSKAFFKYPLKE